MTVRLMGVARNLMPTELPKLKSKESRGEACISNDFFQRDS